MVRTIHTRKGEAYTFRLYWLVTRRQLENAKRNEVGSINDLMPALVFAAFTIEAYINFVGFKVLPDLWRDERKMSFEKKIKAIFAEFGRQIPDCSVDPYQSVISLKNLRDELAHGKPYILDDTFETEGTSTREDFRNLFFKIPLYEKLSLSGLEGAESIIGQAETFVNLIQADLLIRIPDMPFVQENALQGALSSCNYEERLSAGESE